MYNYRRYKRQQYSPYEASLLLCQYSSSELQNIETHILYDMAHTNLSPTVGYTTYTTLHNNAASYMLVELQLKMYHAIFNLPINHLLRNKSVSSSHNSGFLISATLLLNWKYYTHCFILLSFYPKYPMQWQSLVFTDEEVFSSIKTYEVVNLWNLNLAS